MSLQPRTLPAGNDTSSEIAGHEKLRIAFVGGRGVANHYSGIETYYEEIGSRLVERGHTVQVYCRNYFTPKMNTYRGMTVRRLPSVRSKHLDTFMHSFLATVDALPRKLDIVHYHAIGPSLFSFIPRLCGKKTVVLVHGLDWEREKWGFCATQFLKGCEVTSIRFPSATAVVSRKMERYYEDKYGTRPLYIPNGIQCPQARVADRILKYGLKKDGFLLYAGRLSPEKGCHYLLEALRPLNSDKRLVFAGGSSYSEEYIAKLRGLSWDKVLFPGYVDRETMNELYSNCYAFVLPSTMEGLSISLLEALSHGNCIIASDIEENREVMEDAALYFQSENVESLSAALREILEKPALVEGYRRRAEQAASSRFDWEEVTRQTEAFYYRVIARANSRCNGSRV